MNIEYEIMKDAIKTAIVSEKRRLCLQIALAVSILANITLALLMVYVK